MLLHYGLTVSIMYTVRERKTEINTYLSVTAKYYVTFNYWVYISMHIPWPIQAVKARSVSLNWASVGEYFKLNQLESERESPRLSDPRLRLWLSEASQTPISGELRGGGRGGEGGFSFGSYCLFPPNFTDKVLIRTRQLGVLKISQKKVVCT